MMINHARKSQKLEKMYQDQFNVCIFGLLNNSYVFTVQATVLTRNMTSFCLISSGVCPQVPQYFSDHKT